MANPPLTAMSDAELDAHALELDAAVRDLRDRQRAVTRERESRAAQAALAPMLDRLSPEQRAALKSQL